MYLWGSDISKWQFEPLKILVSGAGGFIGTHLCNKLIDDGHKVFSLDRQLLLNPTKLEEEINKIKPDVIFHLGAYGNHSWQKDEDECIASNILGTRFLLKASRKVNKFVYISSSSVYSHHSYKESLSEAHTPIYPMTFYTASKASAESLCLAEKHIHDRDITIIRPFSVYGYGEDGKRFIPRVIIDLLTGKTLDLDPTPVHDWIHVNDLVAGLIKSIRCTFPIVNVCTGIETTNQEIVDKLQVISGKKLKTRKVEGMRSWDTKGMYAGFGGLLGSMGWAPAFDLDRGLKDTYQRIKLDYDRMKEPTNNLSEAIERATYLTEHDVKL